jgi:hypothetical protein
MNRDVVQQRAEWSVERIAPSCDRDKIVQVKEIHENIDAEAVFTA